ncbi:MAG: hypothetical protein JSS78_07805 [Bacteroidetes bacterium]|nr:hypothetical protein [Bacteroidota bacterium]
MKRLATPLLALLLFSSLALNSCDDDKKKSEEDTNTKEVAAAPPADKGIHSLTKTRTDSSINKKAQLRAAVIDPKKIAAWVSAKDADCKLPIECNTDYCSKPECASAVMKCHGISKEVFDYIVAGHESEFVEFSISDLENLLNSSDCATQKWQITFTGSGTGTYNCTVDIVPNTESGGIYYSVLLMRSILATHPTAFSFCYGMSLPDASGTRKEVVAMKVMTGGTEQYFDLTNAAP